MIFLIGIDIVSIDRIEKNIRKKRFLDRIFTEEEQKYIEAKGNERRRAETAAGIFAAKEAVSKALGMGIGKLGWKDIEIKRKASGAPYADVKNKDISIVGMSISISHDSGTAAACCRVNVKGIRQLPAENNARVRLPKRKAETNKGDYGKLAIIGGSTGMAGAPCMSSFSALRTGSGLVYTAVPESISLVASVKSLENIVVPIRDGAKGHFSAISIGDFKEKLKKADTLAIGPGMGTDEETLDVLEELISWGYPTVIDADGINLLAKKKELIKLNSRLVLTPHPMEFSRLTGKPLNKILENRIKAASDFIAEYDVTLVLKGHKTIVMNRKEGYVNSTGNPGMATAGSGDVLTGIIASFLGQKLSPFEAAKAGVYLHGLAGDFAAAEKGEYSMIAGDIIEYLPEAIKTIVGDE